MQYKFYTTSGKAWTAMLAAIQNAHKSIYLESFIFLHDTFPTHNFIAELTAKAQEGVRVCLVVDSVGSYTLDRNEIKKLTDAGGEVVYFSFWFRRIHRKVLVVDETIGFLGGVNIGNEYAQWLDLHLKITARPIIKSLLRSFALSYRLCSGQNKEILKFEKVLPLRRQAGLWLLDHWPMRDAEKLRTYYETRISAAQKSITIVSPYFLPHRWFRKALFAAAKRGVNVEVLLPSPTDPAILTPANLFFAASYYDEGINFFLGKKMNHAKVLLIDDHEGLVGSQNIDAMSFDFNAEVGMGFTNKKMVSDLKAIVARWKHNSTKFTDDYFQRRWYHKPLEFLARFLQPVL